MYSVILFYIFSIICSISISTAQTLSLNGNNWKIKDIPNDSSITFCNDWIPATVPGNIQADLETARILKPLWYGTGDVHLYNVAKNKWRYHKDFKIPVEFSGKRIRIVFDGVDYTCEVWLNGKKIGKNSNMFRRFEFDVADILKIGETNQLDVILESIPTVPALYIEKSDGKESGAHTDWFFVKGMEKTLETLEDLKSPTNFGWDWGVNIWTLGIWKDVRLEASDEAAIEYLKVETRLSDNYSKAKIQVKVVVSSLAAEKGNLKLKINGNGMELTNKTPFYVKKGLNRLYGELELENPALWWPNGHGEQKLYKLEATLLDPSGQVLHTYVTRFGVREICWQKTTEAPVNCLEKYMPVVNGRPIRMIGSNVIPPDLLFARIPERAPHLLQLAKDSGFTALRLWGGGVIFTPEFYDLADSLGIMLILEMPIASLDPRPSPRLLNNLDTTCRNIIHQVWNHPSIIVYVGGNEMNWQHPTTLNYVKRLFLEEDPERIFRNTDPIAGESSHGPWNFTDPTGVYSTWNQLIPRVVDKTGKVPTGSSSYLYPRMFYGEFGYQTPAHLEVWQRDIPRSAQWPIEKENPILIRKNITYAVFDGDAWLEKPVIDFLFGDAPNLEFLLEAGQYIGAEGLRYALDAIRRRGTATGGMLTWDFNEPWTNGAGSYQVDYDGRLLMNNTFVRQAASQLSLSLRYPSSLYNIHDGIKTTLYLTSDVDVTVKNLHWSWKARDRRGRVISSGKGSVGIDPIEVKKLADIYIKLPKKTCFGPVLVELQLSDSEGKVLNERVHIFGLAGERAPLKGLLDNHIPDSDDNIKMLTKLQNMTGNEHIKGWQPPELFRPIKRTKLKLTSNVLRIEGKEEVLDLKLTNTGKMTALFCEPKPMLNYRTDVIIANLYICIPPNESRTIRIRATHTPGRYMTLSQTGWRIESWNADPLIIKPSSDILLAVGREDRMCLEFAGYKGLTKVNKETVIRLEGHQPDPEKVPYIMDNSKTLEFHFTGILASSNSGASLRIHSADQATIGVMISIELNGKSFEAKLPEGYGFQKTDPAQLAQAKTVEITIPAGIVNQGDNIMRIKVIGDGWFTWDSLDLQSLNTIK